MKNDPQSSAPRRVEAYLDTVLAPLPRRLPAFQLEELRRELRTHLWERVAAYEELGQTEDEAVTEALAQFGGGQDFLRQWRREWTKMPRRMTLQEVWEAGKGALRPSLVGISSALLPYFALRACYLDFPKSAVSVYLNSQTHWPGWAWVWLAFLLLPAFAGIRHGRCAPERAGIGMLAALTAEFLAVTLLYQTADWALLSPIWTSPLGLYMREDSDLLRGVMAAWIPIAAGAAAITGWWARRAEGRGMKIAP